MAEEQRLWTWFANLSEPQKKIICDKVNTENTQSLDIYKKLLIEIKKQNALVKALNSKKSVRLNDKIVTNLQTFLDLSIKKTPKVRQSELEERMHMYYIYDIIPLRKQNYSWRDIARIIAQKYNVKYSHVWLQKVFERVIEKYNIQL